MLSSWVMARHIYRWLVFSLECMVFKALGKMQNSISGGYFWRNLSRPCTSAVYMRMYVPNSCLQYYECCRYIFCRLRQSVCNPHVLSWREHTSLFPEWRRKQNFLYGNIRGLECWVTKRHDRGGQISFTRGGSGMSVSERWRSGELLVKFMGLRSW